MNIRRAPPPYNHPDYCSTSFATAWNATFAQTVKDPVVILITLAALIGSVCLLSGLLLLCMVSRLLNDQTAEAVLLMGIGFFICCVAGFTWKLTSRRRLSVIIDAVKQEVA